jgi:hypothetical protein
MLIIVFNIISTLISQGVHTQFLYYRIEGQLSSPCLHCIALYGMAVFYLDLLLFCCCCTYFTYKQAKVTILWKHSTKIRKGKKKMIEAKIL